MPNLKEPKKKVKQKLSWDALQKAAFLKLLESAYSEGFTDGQSFPQPATPHDTWRFSFAKSNFLNPLKK